MLGPMSKHKDEFTSLEDIRISCIIPAYNEEGRIGNVLPIVITEPLIDEVIVVNDGSKDRTAEVVGRFKGVKLIDLKENRGKAFALKTGITSAKGNIILLLDADLIGLNHDNVQELLDPVLNGDADMTLSLRKNSLFIYRILGVDMVSGERAIQKEILEQLGEYEHSRFGFESLLNEFIITNKLNFKSVKWDNVKVSPKHKKRGFWKGIFDEFKMIREIMEVVPITKFFYIMFKMAKNSQP